MLIITINAYYNNNLCYNNIYLIIMVQQWNNSILNILTYIYKVITCNSIQVT